MPGVLAKKKTSRVLPIVLVSALSVSGLGGWWYLQGASGPKRPVGNYVTDVAKRGPFQIVVTERGQLDSMKNAILTSRVEGSATIISIVPEGQQVKTGDVVCELDRSTLVEKESQQRIGLTQAQAAYRQASENMEIQRTQNDSAMAAAKLKLELAQLDLERFEKGEYVQQVNELESQVSLKRENMAKAMDEYEYVKRLVRKGIETQNKLEAARIAVNSAEIDCSIAEGKLDVFSQYNKRRTLAELRANAQEFEREVSRVERQNNAALEQKKAELTSRQLTMEVEENKLRKIREQIENCVVRASQDGQVVYANSRDSREGPTIYEGATVRERQALIQLPDYEFMKVNARIHESRISLIKSGQKVRVLVDAYADEVFHGEVDTVATVPSSTSSFVRDLKEYETVVKILDEPEKVQRLRTGLTAQVEIMVEQREGILQVPVQSVVTVVGHQYAYVLKEGMPERRDIRVGQTNDRVVEVLDGVAEGEVVIMNPRSSFAREIQELDAELSKKQQEQANGATEKADGASATEGKPAEPKKSPEAPKSTETSAGGIRSASKPAEGGSPAPSGGTRDPAARFKELDKNSDGKLTSDEADERAQRVFAMGDTDGDGSISLAEWTDAMAKLRASRGAPPPAASN